MDKSPLFRSLDKFSRNSKVRCNLKKKEKKETEYREVNFFFNILVATPLVAKEFTSQHLASFFFPFYKERVYQLLLPFK